MKKLAALQYDVTDLVTAGKIDYLINVTQGQDELVKNAHVPSPEEVDEIPDEKFALILFHPHLGKMKKLAMTDKYVTELNMRIFEDRIDSLPEEIVKTAAYHLCKAAKHYGIKPSEKLKKYASEHVSTNWINLAQVKPVVPTMEKAAEAGEYALGKKYPIHTAGLVKKAVAYFDANWKRFSPANALQFAVNVKVAADKHRVSYAGTRIEKYANLSTAGFNSNFKAAVLARKGYTAAEDRQVYDELITKSAELGTVKTAELLEELDRATGVNRVWNVSVEDPILTVFEQKIPRIVKYARYSLTQEDLNVLPEGIVDPATRSDLVGPDGLDVFESLPRPVKDKIVGALTKRAERMQTNLHEQRESVVEKLLPTQNHPKKAGNYYKDAPTSQVLEAIGEGMIRP